MGVGFLGLMTLLGKDSGGFIGLAIGGTLAALIGDTGAAIIGGALFLAGFLLVSGASTGAILRRTGHVMHRAGSGARRAFEWTSSESPTEEDLDPVEPVAVRATMQHQLLDGAEAYPDVVGPSVHSQETSIPADDGAGARKRRVGVRDVDRALGVPTARSQSPSLVSRDRNREGRRGRRQDRRPARREPSRSSASRRRSPARSRARASRATSCSSRRARRCRRSPGSRTT